ncbi:MAG: hypothetical protein IPJ65_03705 [Archangiaceae bacterium]|nr:hypothetical protein [Archangiaceae bacterium]
MRRAFSLGVTLAFAACGEGEIDNVAGDMLGSDDQQISARICPGPNTVQGVDVSMYQRGINWSAVKASGMAFAITRIGDGTYQDPYFDQNWAGIKAAGLIRGAYQFFEPGIDPTTQANIVVAKVGRLGAGDLPVMLDVEATGGQSPATITARIHTWMNVVAAGTGKKPFIYTGAYFWDSNVQSYDFNSYALDVAWYGTNCPGVPNAWANQGWTFHQFTSTGSVSGISGNVDVNVFNGTYAQLQAFAGGGSGAGSTRRAFAFQANTTSLWTVVDGATRDWGLGMMPGTSPAIAVLDDGNWVVAFQANTSELWTAGSVGVTNWHLGMMPGTSPAVTALRGGGFEIAFQANTTSLWTVGSAGNRDWGLGMHRKSSPAIAGLAGGGFEVAFEANTTSLWTVGSAGNTDWHLGMYAGSSPAIAALTGGGFQVAFEANTTSLWTVGSAGNRDWGLGMMAGTSPAITGLSNGGFQAAFEANTTSLWTTGSAGMKDWGLGMMSGTSPSIVSYGDGFQVSFEANTTSLWTVGSAGNTDWHLGMYSGTNPSGG